MAQARIRDCACPGTPHAEEGDIVFLRDTITLTGGLAAERVIVEVKGITDDAAIDEALTPRLLDVYLRDGVTGWNVVDEDGPIPVDVDMILSDYTLALPVAKVAEGLYTQAVMRPLTDRLSAISRRGSTSVSTSRTRTQTRKPSKSSSRATSAATKPLPA
jgi:hypothetical protein